MTVARIRVLVVDDSAFARKVVREVLSSDEAIEVVGIARDGLDALEMIAALRPDVVTLDLLMPNLDGLGVLRALSGIPGPRCVVVSTSDEQSDLAIQALQEGAVELVHKPTALATDRLYDLSYELVSKVKAAFAAHHPALRRPGGLPIEDARANERPASRVRAVVIGTSTGGPQALTHLLAQLPPDLPVPLAMVLHIPAGYTAALAKRLDDLCSIDVAEAYDGIVLRPGLAVLSRGGVHMKIERQGTVCRVRLDMAPAGTPHRPSVDVLFESASHVYGPQLLGIVLTGMGQDGLEGARAIRAGGGMVFSEAAASCVVYGMPRAVYEAGLSDRAVPLDAMATAITQSV